MDKEEYECLRIHGYVFSSDSESESGKSDFDEEYNLLKPPPISPDVLEKLVVKISKDFKGVTLEAPSIKRDHEPSKFPYVFYRGVDEYKIRKNYFKKQTRKIIYADGIYLKKRGKNYNAKYKGIFVSRKKKTRFFPKVAKYNNYYWHVETPSKCVQKYNKHNDKKKDNLISNVRCQIPKLKKKRENRTKTKKNEGQSRKTKKCKIKQNDTTRKIVLPNLDTSRLPIAKLELSKCPQQGNPTIQYDKNNNNAKVQKLTKRNKKNKSSLFKTIKPPKTSANLNKKDSTIDIRNSEMQVLLSRR